MLLLLTGSRRCVDAGKCLSSWEGRAWSQHCVWTGYGLHAYGVGRQELISVGFNAAGLLGTIAFSS